MRVCAVGWRCCLLPWALVWIAQAASAQPFVFPRFASGSQIEADCNRLMVDLKALEARLQEQGGGDGTLLAEIDAITLRQEDTLGPMWLMAAVHPEKAVRDAAETCNRKAEAFNAAFHQNPRIHALLKSAVAADDIDRRYLRDLLDAFEDSGASLPADRQRRAQEISNRITQLDQDFDRRIREDKTRVPFGAAELKGVPASVWKAARRDAQGRYLLGLDYPTSYPVVDNARSETARARMWRALQSQGGPDNLKTMSELVALRREYAGLFGFDSYADFALRRRMVQGAAVAQAFLGSVRDAVRQRELADLALLRDAKASELKRMPESVRLERWDLGYYTERVREARYALNQEQFRPFFAPDASLNFVFRVATRLFGVSFTALPQTLWHADARAFEVRDLASGNSLGTLFVDLYPRADKYNHAAVWPFRNGSTLAGRRPAAALVVNFNRQGLTLEELETLLHEFGHAMHALLSDTRYAGQAGTNVRFDFSEAPSQMLEDWVYEPQVLAVLKEACSACRPVPATLIAQAERARHFAKGVRVSRQHLYASYDLALYGQRPEDPLLLWARMEGDTPLGHAPGTLFPASFGHLAGDYAAGYYSYLWSLVLAEDMRTAFAADRLDAAVGKRYRATVLANGGQVEPGELVRRFLGRPSNSEAFFQFLNKQ